MQLVFYLLWGHLQTTWAFYISSVMASAQAAVIWAVSIAIFSGLIANLVMVRARAAAPARCCCGGGELLQAQVPGGVLDAALTPPCSCAQVQFVQYGPAWLALVLQLLPSFGLYRGLWELSQYAFLADANGGTGGAADGWLATDMLKQATCS
jgi:hypothetical protein